MSKLSPEAAAILAAARKDLDASAEVVARVRSAVAARVEAEPPASAVRSRTIWSNVARPGPIVALALLGAVLATKVVASSSKTTPKAIEAPSDMLAENARPSDPPSDDHPPSEPADPIPTFAVTSLPDRPLPTPERRGRPSEPHIAPPAATAPEIDKAKAPATTTDDLLEESRLLRSAQVDLQAHRAGAALHSLEEHAARFPGGVLREERLTLRVLVLCESGDVDAARRARRELDRSFPATSHASRLANSCAASDPEGAR
ncbi:hypothetical protein AKJ09_06850 [Labilithrix luteola]|uniref:Uncharacterized protein n=1 Tax=Labilithrix luteola TaxID=1391654 RepID=A0A0K1Q3H9_9BACT|nr:hypothetical protein [Labilithrix luteola]AKV00187.1 hypothetical protein AKJ09_06850 [Labilithrix luteola]